MSYSSLAQLVQHYESGGNYTATNPNSTASGAYQFTNGTWTQYANQIDPSIAQQYPTAASAPPGVQDQVFAQAVSTNGLNDWTCPNCNPALTSYLSNNPSAAALPIGTGNMGGGSTLAQGPPDTSYGGPPSTLPDPAQYPGIGQGTGEPMPSDYGSSVNPGTTLSPSTNPSTTAAGALPGYIPPGSTGGPYAFGLSAGTAIAAGGWVQSFENTITNAVTSTQTAVGNWATNAFQGVLKSAENYTLRGVLIVVAVIVMAIALFRLLAPNVSASDVAKLAAA